jgi:protein arginine kinase
MAIKEILDNKADWLKSGGPVSPYVVSSRVRFARNIRGAAFPGWAGKQGRVETLKRILPAVSGLPEMHDAHVLPCAELDPIEKQVLVERHLVSREHSAKSAGSAAVINRRQTLSVMINEEDHLRMQALRSGLQLKSAYRALDKLDSELEEKLDFAFSSDLGYLTACPSNVGTGMRASAMLHLPGLSLSEQITQVVQSVNRIGLAVRGLYGEGSESIGNLFQISNQTTLGESEEEIIERIHRVILQIVEHEKNARQVLMRRQMRMLMDHVGRAFGLLRYSWSIGTKEACSLLSLTKLGADLGFFPEDTANLMDELFILIQPAHLQRLHGQKLDEGARDTARADLLRQAFTAVPEPAVMSSEGTPRAGDTVSGSELPEIGPADGELPL